MTATTAPRRCLVTGATGYVGARLVPRLLAAGHDVAVLARTPAKLDEVPWRDQVEVFEGDLAEVESLRVAFRDVDVVFYLVHSMGTADDFEAEERRSATNVVDAAQSEGVGRIVYLSGLHPGDEPLSRHLRSRVEVGDVLMASDVPTMVLQAGVVIGSGSASFEMLRHLTDRLPVMTTPRWVDNRIQPIAVSDALHYLVGAATADLPASRTYDIGGPEVLTYREMMRQYAEAAGLPRRLIVGLPGLTPTLASRWVGLVTPMPAGLARPLVESLEHDAVVHETDIDAVIAPPEGGLTSYREALAQALDHDTRGEEVVRWDRVEAGEQPAAPLPSDAPWAGETTVSATHRARIAAPPAVVLEAARELVDRPTGLDLLAPRPMPLLAAVTARSSRPRSAGQRPRWRLDDGGSEQVRLRADAPVPGDLWLVVTASPAGPASDLGLRAVFLPRGLGGLAWWQATRLPRRSALARLADHLDVRAVGV